LLSKGSVAVLARTVLNKWIATARTIGTVCLIEIARKIVLALTCRNEAWIAFLIPQI
jgi:hypothetical protein